MPESVDDVYVPVHLEALGVPVVVRARGNGAQLLAERIRHAWAWCLGGENDADLTDPIEIDVVLDSRADSVERARRRGLLADLDVDELLHALSPIVTIQAITRQQSNLLMLHACGLADPRTGGTVALVGASGAGKTTAATLLGREFGYVSDETVALRGDDSIVPYPKPLSILDRGTHVKSQVSPSDLGLLRPCVDAHLVGLVVLSRDAGAAQRPTVEPVDTVRALAELSPQISALGDRPRPLHRLASTVEAAGGLKRVTYREAADLGPVLRDLAGMGQ